MRLVSRTHVAPSETLAVHAKALQKIQAGERVYNLSAGEPVIPTPPPILEAAHQAIDSGKTHYEPAAGVPALRQAASVWMNQSYGGHFSVAQTMITCGGKHAIFLALQALLEPDDEVLVISPYWVSYPSMVNLCGGVPVLVPTQKHTDWKVTAALLETYVSNKTKVLIFNNAANPTGVLYTRDEVKHILEWAATHDLVVVSDEVYSGLVYDSVTYSSCASFVEHEDRVVVVQSCSKNFAMTGWRVGALFGPEVLIQACTALQGQSTTGTSSISQYAAIAAFEYAQELTQNIQRQMQQRRNYFLETFAEIFGRQLPKPQSALYAFVSIEAFGAAHTDSSVFCAQVLDQANVATVPGVGFGQDGYVRLSFGQPESEIKDALKALWVYCNNG